MQDKYSSKAAQLSVCILLLICRYKQQLARAVKNELNLDSTPTTDMGEQSEEVHQEAPAVPIQPKATMVSTPVTIGSLQPAKPQPKGNLVVNSSTLHGASVVRFVCRCDCSRPSRWPTPKRSLACLSAAVRGEYSTGRTHILERNYASWLGRKEAWSGNDCGADGNRETGSGNGGC